MKKKLLIVCALTLSLYSLMGTTGFEDSSESHTNELRKKFEIQQQKLIGKTVYGYFDRSSCRYPNNLAIQSTPNYMDRNRFTANSPMSFVVEKIVYCRTRGLEHLRYYRVKVEDGSVGFIATSAFQMGDPEKEKSLRESCIFELEPKEIQAKLDQFEMDKKTKLAAILEEQQKAEKVALEIALQVESESLAEKEAQRKTDDLEVKKQEAIASLPDARIGMNAKQVIYKTNWGKPESVNTTTTQYGVEEQWVYGSSNYLYFKNGRLTAIQN